MEEYERVQIDRAFVRIREGQVHLRRAGAGAGTGADRGGGKRSPRPLWMLHASPASSVSLVGLMQALAPGRSVIAPDTLGNGDSAPAEPAVPDCVYYAAASLRVMDALGIEQVDLYGSHTGAHIATEIAIARPDRVGRVVLDGVGLFTPEEKRDFGAHYAPSILPDSTGAQFHWALNFVRDQGWFFPYFKREPEYNRHLGAPSAEALHRTTVEVLKALTTYHHAYRAAFAHPDRERLPLLRAPTLAMADEEDPLRRGLDEALALLPNGQKLLFRGASEPDGLRRKAAAIAKFLDAPSP